MHVQYSTVPYATLFILHLILQIVYYIIGHKKGDYCPVKTATVAS